MSLCKTPVQVKTEKAKKMAMAEMTNLAHINAMAEGESGRLPATVKVAISNNRHTLEANKSKCVQTISELFTAYMNGNYGVMSTINSVFAQMDNFVL